MSNKIYDRKTQKYNLLPKPNKWLKFLYCTFIGRVLLTIATQKIFSYLVGIYMNSRQSRDKITKFIEKNNINMDDYEEETYASFNAFFTRKIKPGRRPIEHNKNVLIAVADSKILRYRVKSDLVLNIKNSLYKVEDLINDKEEAQKYVDGECLVLRLDVDDYHRYVYVDDGEIIKTQKINGVLHTVNPISDEKYRVYSQNSREWVKIKTKNFGDVIQMEVGALCVGKIKNFDYKNVLRGQEKGYFEFGGSTIILLFKKNTIRVDQDILENSFVDVETIVKQGERIGLKL